MPDDDKLRFLLVDEEPAIPRAHGRALTRHGVVVETATNGKEAVDRVLGSRRLELEAATW
jgi:CheY-like chemotaxis protein